MVREGTVEEILNLMGKVPEFRDPYPKEELEKRLCNHVSLILVEEEDGTLRGFKCGYDREGDGCSFYSWLGAVVPEHRRSEIASQLLHSMERWCREKEYQNLKFKTRNQHKSMLIFAIKSGFEIVDVIREKDKSPRIWLSKKIK